MSEANAVPVICSNPDCRIADTGKCVEGFERDKCPHFGHGPEESEKISSEKSNGIALPSGATLTLAETSQLLRIGDARVVAIIGPSDAGKTSLIASLYDLFQEGPVANVCYARSRTLPEFEQTCHDARAASRRNIPHINRTPRGDARFYHLDLGGGRAGTRLALALADRAGEEYRSAIDDASIVSTFFEIHRADSLTVLVDGERLLDSGDRHNLRSEITLILQALIDGAALPKDARVALVLTKLDLVQESGHQARAEADFASLGANLEKLFGDAFSVIESFKTAASPKSKTVRRGTGISDLLTFWLEASPPPQTSQPMMASPARAFARLRPVWEEVKP